MTAVTLNQVLELTNKLPAEEQDMLLELMNRRRTDRWRKDLAKYSRKVEKDFHAGKLKSENAESLIARWENEWAGKN